MHLEIFLILAILAIGSFSTDEKLHKIVKRNRFKMKDKAVMYNDSLEDDKDSSEFITTLKPINAVDEEEVSDTEKEVQRLADQMKKGVSPINIDEYINEEDAELAINDDPTSTTHSPITHQSKPKKAS